MKMFTSQCRNTRAIWSGIQWIWRISYHRHGTPHMWECASWSNETSWGCYKHVIVLLANMWWVFKDDKMQGGYSVDDGAVMLSKDILTTSSLPPTTIKVSNILDGKFCFLSNSWNCKFVHAILTYLLYIQILFIHYSEKSVSASCKKSISSKEIAMETTEEIKSCWESQCA